MAPIVSLHAVVDELDSLGDETYAYLNKRTGQLVTIGCEEIAIVEDSDDLEDVIAAYPGWQQDLIRETKEVLDSDDMFLCQARLISMSMRSWSGSVTPSQTRNCAR